MISNKEEEATIIKQESKRQFRINMKVKQEQMMMKEAVFAKKMMKEEERRQGEKKLTKQVQKQQKRKVECAVRQCPSSLSPFQLLLQENQKARGSMMNHHPHLLLNDDHDACDDD